MYLLRRFHHAYGKGTETGALVQIVAAALRAGGHGELRFHGYFADDPRGKVSGIARLIAHHPGVVTQSEALVATMTACDLATAIAIADGVPRRYPLAESHLWVTPVELFELTAATRRTAVDAHGEADFPEIVVHSRSRTSRREVNIRSAIATPAPPPSAKRLPPLPTKVREVLEALGKPGREERRMVREPAEDEALNARNAAVAPQIAALNAALEASWATFAFVHDLVDDHRHEEHDMDIRAELALALRAIGWSQSSSGFRKRLPGDGVLTLKYDRGPLGNQTWTSLSLSGPDWGHAISLWPRRSSKELRIRSRRTANAYAANIAAAATHAIAHWATPIEALYAGPSVTNST